LSHLPRRPKTRTLKRWMALCLFLMMFFQMNASVMLKSPTFDEPAHVFRGCLTWRYAYTIGDPAHWFPGLLCLLAPELPTFDEPPNAQLKYRNAFFEHLDFSPDVLIFPARLLIMGLTLLLGAIVYRWGQILTQGQGGLLALALLAFEPNLLAHGRLMTEDVLATFVFTLSLYLYWVLLHRPGPIPLLATGASLGFALSGKPYAPVLFPVLGLMTLAWGMRQGGWRGLGHKLLVLLSILVIASLVQWGLAGFPARNIPILSAFGPFQRLLTKTAQAVTSGVTRNLGWPAYVLGQRSFQGWWFYFPLLLLVKTPLPLLIGTLIGTACLIKEQRWFVLSALSLPLWMLVGYTRLSLNIGYRHLLPAVPFFALLSACALIALKRRGRRTAWLAGGLLLWLGLSSLRVYPHYLTYFNEIAGGAQGGIRFFTDSNLDWGQDLKGLGRWMEQEGVEEVHLSYFGSVPPETYGIRYQPLYPEAALGEPGHFSPMAPAPGIYAISATNLTGQYLLSNPSVFSWFWRQEPIATIGHTIWIFEVPPDPDAPRWAAVCLPPELPPLHILEDQPALDLIQALQRGVKAEGALRLIPFDCSRGWPVGHEGGAAWLLIPSADGQVLVISPPVGEMTPVYRQEDYPGDLLFQVSRWTPGTLLYPAFTDPTDPAGTTGDTPGAIVGQDLLLEQVAFSPATPDPGQTVDLVLVWRVLQAPAASISFMAHLWDAEGRPIAVDDGNAIPSEHWRAGDRLLHTHRLTVPPGTPAGRYRLVTGAYTVPGLERLSVLSQDGERLGDSITVGEVQVP
jgi:hypothetical protein